MTSLRNTLKLLADDLEQPRPESGAYDKGWNGALKAAARQIREVLALHPQAPRPPVLPNPSMTENGYVRCNEPLLRGGEVVGYCQRYVKPGPTWRMPAGQHRGRHRIEWGWR